LAELTLMSATITAIVFRSGRTPSILGALQGEVNVRSATRHLAAIPDDATTVQKLREL
jgi:hypothetical protein